MEAVAWVAGEPHSDRPRCASPVLGAIMRGLNDRFTDDERQLLAPLIPRLVGTRASADIERKRAYVMVDAAIREFAPMGLDAVKWTDLADRMRAIAPIVDMASAQSALTICREIRSAASGRRGGADAYAAADAYAYAAAAAYAAYAAAYAYADAYAYAAAAYAAYAAAYAYAYAYAYAAAAAAAAADADADKLSPEERARIRSLARRPIVEATVRAYGRAIAIVA
jgi:hypothetical protein